jgi:histone-lysine N-methyltransferase SETMAR
VPHSLTPEQKQKRINCCCGFIKFVEDDADILKRIVTDDESLCFQYNPETKRQNMEWRSTNSPGQKKIRLQKSGLKTMLIVFFDIRGIIHKECIPQGTTVVSHATSARAHVSSDTRRVRHRQLAAVVRQRPSHCALNVKHLLAKKAITTIEHPPDLPDLAPADYFLFPRIKRALKGQRFDVINAIQE